MARIASATGVPCETRTSTWRSLETISSGGCLFWRIVILRLALMSHTSGWTTATGADHGRLQGYKPASADRVTEINKENQLLSAAGYAVTQLHAFDDARANLFVESAELPADDPVSPNEVLLAIEVSIERFEQE